MKFALPKEENTLEARVNEEQEEVVVDQFDVVDERISLLQVYSFCFFTIDIGELALMAFVIMIRIKEEICLTKCYYYI